MTRRSVTLGLSLICACASPASNSADHETDTGTDDTSIAEGGDSEGGDTTGSYDEPPCGDTFEPNEQVETATRLLWDEIAVLGEGVYDARVTLDARLCETEHDWYWIPVADLEFQPQVVRIDAIVEGSSWCGQLDGCDDASLASGPEHTIAVEIYDAASMVLLTAAVATDGRIDVDGWGDDYDEDLVLHVYSPVSATTFAYELHVDVRNDDSDVACECG